MLMLFVIFSNPTDRMITRDYVTYLTSNSVLIGAEVDKILSIVLVTLVLAVAVMRAQRVLNKAVSEGAAAQDLSRFVSVEVADRIKSADKAIEPGDGESKVATILFTDIQGFSTVSEKLTPQELAHTLNDYFGAMSEVIAEHGGVITHFEGDLMLITFNAVSSNSDHAANAIRTALAIQKVANGRTFGKGAVLKTRCGINTGEIVIGAVGSRDRLTFTVHGDNVNVAARLEQLNKEYGTYIMATESTVATCGGAFSFKPVCEVTVRGRKAPTKVFTVAA
jgi:adenylate cyclase